MPTQQEIAAFYAANANNPAAIQAAMAQYGVSPEQAAAATGQTAASFQQPQPASTGPRGVNAVDHGKGVWSPTENRWISNAEIQNYFAANPNASATQMNKLAGQLGLNPYSIDYAAWQGTGGGNLRDNTAYSQLAKELEASQWRGDSGYGADYWSSPNAGVNPLSAGAGNIQYKMPDGSLHSVSVVNGKPVMSYQEALRGLNTVKGQTSSSAPSSGTTTTTPTPETYMPWTRPTQPTAPTVTAGQTAGNPTITQTPAIAQTPLQPPTNSFPTPVLNALYAAQQQRMSTPAPTFNFQNGMQAQPTSTTGPLTQVAQQPPPGSTVGSTMPQLPPQIQPPTNPYGGVPNSQVPIDQPGGGSGIETQPYIPPGTGGLEPSPYANNGWVASGSGGTKPGTGGLEMHPGPGMGAGGNNPGTGGQAVESYGPRPGDTGYFTTRPPETGGLEPNPNWPNRQDPLQIKSDGLQYATGVGGIGLDKYQSNIRNWLQENGKTGFKLDTGSDIPGMSGTLGSSTTYNGIDAQTAQQMMSYGISPEDYANATGTSLYEAQRQFDLFKPGPGGMLVQPPGPTWGTQVRPNPNEGTDNTNPAGTGGLEPNPNQIELTNTFNRTPPGYNPNEWGSTGEQGMQKYDPTGTGGGDPYSPWIAPPGPGMGGGGNNPGMGGGNDFGGFPGIGAGPTDMHIQPPNPFIPPTDTFTASEYKPMPTAGYSGLLGGTDIAAQYNAGALTRAIRGH